MSLMSPALSDEFFTTNATRKPSHFTDHLSNNMLIHYHPTKMTLTFKRSFSIKFYLGDVVAVVQLLSCVQLFAAPWTAARFTITWSLLKLMFIELMMLSILCHPLLFLLSIVPSIIKVFSNESVLHIRWPKYWSFSILPVNIQD